MSENMKDKQSPVIFKGINEEAELSEIKKALVYRESVDYTKMWEKSSVVFFGERHTVIADKDEIISNLSNFKKQGLTHVVMEMFEEDQQPIIDRYFNGEIAKEEFSDFFKSCGWDNGHGVVNKYIEIVDTAKNLDLKLLALDLNYQNISFSEAHKKRNQNWARIIKDVVSIPNNKVLVFCGSGHCGYNMIHDNANEMLNVSNISTTVVKFAGSDEESIFLLRDKIAFVTKEIGAENERFQIKLDSTTPTRTGDYIVHLPSNNSK